MELHVASESKVYRLKGDFWIKMGKDLTRDQIIEKPDRQDHNLIVDICSDLIASWAFTRESSLFIPGILTLAVGTGDTGWDIQNPPVETADETQLYSELYRKQFATVTYVDHLGSPTNVRTNVVDFLTTFLESEASGPLVEMGLFGGVGALNTNGGSMINCKNFKVINKPATSQLSVLFRLTF